MSGRESERPIVPTKRGNSTEGPRGGKGTPFQTTVGGKHGGCIGTRGRVHETTTDSGTRSAKPGDGIHVPGLLHRHRLAPGGVPAYAQGRGGGRGRTERRGLRGGPGGQPPVAAGPSQVRHVPGAAGASGAHPQGRLGDRDSTARDTDLRGQGASACGRHGPGSGLRAGLQGRLVRLPSRTIGAPKPWRASGSRRWRWEAAGSWRSISENSSIPHRDTPSTNRPSESLPL